jgi:hypothetical protein
MDRGIEGRILVNDDYFRAKSGQAPSADADPDAVRRGEADRIWAERQRAEAEAAERRQQEETANRRRQDEDAQARTRDGPRQPDPYPPPSGSIRPFRPGPPQEPLTLAEFLAGLGALPLIVGLIAGGVALFLGDDYQRVALIAAEIGLVTMLAAGVAIGDDDTHGLLIVVAAVWGLLAWRGYVEWLPRYYW